MINLIRNGHFDSMEWGVRDGALLHISEVDSGEACDCHCIDCNAVLLARKGTLNAHHFAHKNNTPLKNCGETALHKAAKQCVANMGSIMLPEYHLEIGTKDGAFMFNPISLVEMQISGVALEKPREGYIPDCTIHDPYMGLLDIEIMVTHKVDDEKVLKVRASGIEMIEIDLSRLLNKRVELSELEDAIHYAAPRQWINKINRLEYKELANAVIQQWKSALCMKEASWGRSYGKLLGKKAVLEDQLARLQGTNDIVKKGMTDEQALNALGRVALDGI